MPALHEVQARFFDAVMFGGEAEDRLLACIEEPPAVARGRIAACRRSILGNLVGALLATYPVLARIVGLPFFREAARAYVRAHPSSSGDLNEYGAGFADFIAAYPYGRELGYLADVARLEWLVQQTYYAPDSAPADLSLLAACPPERYGELRFGLASGFARLDSLWPLADIWRVNAEHDQGDMTVDFSRGSRTLILRRDGMVHVEALGDGEAVFIDALAENRSLAVGAGFALQAEATFDLGAALTHLVSAGVIRRALLTDQTQRGGT
jgi:hypothetical protein